MRSIIIVDSAEPTEIKVRLQEKATVQVQKLPVGDYYITGEYGEALLTRKTYLDLARSIGDGSLWTELNRMSEVDVENKALVLEGNIDSIFQYKNYSFGAVSGMIVQIAFRSGLGTIPTRDLSHTVYCIADINEKLGKDKVVRHWKARHLPRIDESERPRYLVEGLPGVGAKKSKALLEHFGTALDVFLATVEELQEVDGIGKAMAEKIYNAVRQPYKPRKKRETHEESEEEEEG